MSPYKDKEKQREYAKEAMQRKRLTSVGITKEDNVIPKKEGITGIDSYGRSSYFKDGIEMVSGDGILLGRPRFLVLSDGQVLDRANQPGADVSRMSRARAEALRRCFGTFTPLSGDSSRLKDIVRGKKCH